MKITYRFELRGAHWHLTIWINGKNSGNLIVGNAEKSFLEAVVSQMSALGGTEER